MLVLSRKVGEQIYVGDDILITIVEIKGNRMKLGIEAPKQVTVLRGELHEADSRQGGPAFSTSAG